MRIQMVISLLLFYSYTFFGQANVEKWKVYEITLVGPSTGNPFKEVKLSGKFIKDNDTISISGFYDGDGIYRIRFMPQKEGKRISMAKEKYENA